MLATASAQVCVPLGHSSLYLSMWWAQCWIDGRSHVSVIHSISMRLFSKITANSSTLPLLVVYIDNLNPQCVVHKFIDDTTLTETLLKGNESAHIFECCNTWITSSPGLQTTVWSLTARRQKKWFLVLPTKVHRLTISNSPVESVTCFKLLGINICNDLRWDAHVDALCSKVASRLYFLKLLKD